MRRRSLSEVQDVDQLQQNGIPVFMLDPHGIAGIYSSIASLGRALNREKSATQLIAKLHARENAVRESVRGKPVISIFCRSGMTP